jgi:hypothetical protein
LPQSSIASRRARRFVSVGAATAILAWAAAWPVAAARPPFKLPFDCGETYQGSTYGGHGRAIDFNQDNGRDAGDPVVASRGGRVVSDPSWATRNGEITIKHGGGWQTKYAHMSRITVTRGESVAAGQLVGYVDDVGWATADHLHYEQIHERVTVRSRFDGVRYPYGKAIRSTNCADTAPPEITAPDPGFVRGTTMQMSGATVPLRDTWTVHDTLSGVKRFDLQRDTGSGSFVQVSRSTDPSSPSFSSYLVPDATSPVTDRINAIDNAGNVSTWAAGPTIRVRAVDDGTGTPELAYTGIGWEALTAADDYFRGTSRRTSVVDNSVTLTKDGHDYAIVATTGPGKGMFEVYLDGFAAGVVDLYRPAHTYRQIVWQVGFGSSGTHTVELRVLGEKNPASSATVVDLDAFLILHP